MGNVRSRPRPTRLQPILIDSSTNTVVPYVFLSSDANEQIHQLQTKIDILTLRLERAENESKIALEQLWHHNQRTIEAIDYYRRLSIDITLEKECEIEQLGGSWKC